MDKRYTNVEPIVTEIKQIRDSTKPKSAPDNKAAGTNNQGRRQYQFLSLIIGIILLGLPLALYVYNADNFSEPDEQPITSEDTPGENRERTN